MFTFLHTIINLLFISVFDKLSTATLLVLKRFYFHILMPNFTKMCYLTHLFTGDNNRIGILSYLSNPIKKLSNYSIFKKHDFHKQVTLFLFKTLQS